MNGNRDLLVFAHSLEAQAFFRSQSFKRESLGRILLHQGMDYDILITGEGLPAATRSLCTALALHKNSEGDRWTRVVNLGAAGSFDRNLNFLQPVLVRTSYRRSAFRMEFRSFSLEKASWQKKTEKIFENKSENALENAYAYEGKGPLGIPTADCVSSDERILEPSQAYEISLFGSLVDRELWGLADICQFFEVSLLAIKVVSDQPSLNTQELMPQNICTKVQELAPQISEVLRNTYEQYLGSKHEKKHVDPKKKTSLLDEFPRDFFYFTKTLQSEFKKMEQSLLVTYGDTLRIMQELNLEPLHDKGLTAKVRAMRFLNLLRGLQDPVQSQIRMDLEALLAQTRNSKIQVRFDPQLENPNLSVSFEVQNKSELQSVLEQLNSLPMEQVESLFQGGGKGEGPCFHES